MLYRPPPPWSSLPTPETGPSESQRKKAKLDTPLADMRTLSADGVRERVAVKTAVTALHASLKERRASHAAADASSAASGSTAEAERLVSSNPFARSGKLNNKARTTSKTEGQDATGMFHLRLCISTHREY